MCIIYLQFGSYSIAGYCSNILRMSLQCCKIMSFHNGCWLDHLKIINSLYYVGVYMCMCKIRVLGNKKNTQNLNDIHG